MTGGWAPPGGAPGDDARSRGGGVTIAAWIAIAAGVAILVGVSWAAALGWSAGTLSAAQVGDTGTLAATAIVPGMCLEQTGDDGGVREATVVPCDQAHRAEVLASEELALARLPAPEDLAAQALGLCGDRLEGLLPDDASWVAWTPSPDSWARGDRTVLCIATFAAPLDEPLSHSGRDGLDGSDDAERSPEDAQNA